MLERSRSFDIHDKNYDDIQRVMENVLEKSLSLSINSERLGNSLFRINYIDNNIDKELQNDNIITILQEQEKRVYIQIKGNLTDAQVRQLWNEFEKNLNNATIVYIKKGPSPSKEDIIQDIKRLIQVEGYTVKDREVQRFIENFIEKYNRIPNENEFHSIVKGYMIMVNEDYLIEKTETPIKNESLSESQESVLDSMKQDLSSNSYNSSVSVIENIGGRRKCPSCGNEGLIHEVDDKNVILMDYPKIYAKKLICSKCGHEWRTH
jgi:hypothetical protein